jgi:hypothetical protein
MLIKDAGGPARFVAREKKSESLSRADGPYHTVAAESRGELHNRSWRWGGGGM